MEQRAPLSDSNFLQLIVKTGNTANSAVTGNTTEKFMGRTFDTIKVLRLSGNWKRAVNRLVYSVTLRILASFQIQA